MKSGLANIGANVLSASAAALEQAGRNGDMAVIRDNLASFRAELAALMARISEITAEARSGSDEAGPDAASEALLRETLVGLQAALEARDTDVVDSALAKLQSLPLTSKTRAAVDDIARHVLFGDLKKAAEAVNALLEREI
jgi:HPt (histidine-containing phosphotransfer) domain-containing protein